MKPACAQSTNAHANPGEQTPLPATVAEIGKIHFEGNIVPHEWYQRVTLASGKPDLPAITILAEIIYRYRPYRILDKKGQPHLRKRFDGDMFQCSAAYYEKKFGLTKTQARRAITRLEEAGLIKRELRDVVVGGIMRNYVMFIEPLPLAIMAITKPTTLETPPPGPSGTLSPTGETLSPVGETLSLKSHHTEITTETTTEISTEKTTTTPNPSSSTEGAAEPELVRSGSGAQDEQTENQNGNSEAATLELDEKQPVNQEEGQTAPTTEASSAIPTETPKTVVQDEAKNDPQPELTALAQLPDDEPLHDELVSSTPDGEEPEREDAEAESIADAARDLSGADDATPEATPEATQAKPSGQDAQIAPQDGLKGAQEEEPQSSTSCIGAPPEGRLQADLAGVIRVTETTLDISPPHRCLEAAKTTAPLPADAEDTEDAPLVYPAKLSELERSDMAAQVRALPPAVAQQMLDVIQARLQNGLPIRTNPAALLRGIVRKYRADPDSFDPSGGFQVAEARRRRAEAERRRQAEAEQQARERESRYPTPAARAVGRQALASMLRSLRGR